MDQDQRAINDAEWSDPENWSGSLLGVYFSKRDSRIWVPKSARGLGWTLNLGHPAGVRWFYCLLLWPSIVLLTVLISFVACAGR